MAHVLFPEGGSTGVARLLNSAGQPLSGDEAKAIDELCAAVRNELSPRVTQPLDVSNARSSHDELVKVLRSEGVGMAVLSSSPGVGWVALLRALSAYISLQRLVCLRR